MEGDGVGLDLTLCFILRSYSVIGHTNDKPLYKQLSCALQTANPRLSGIFRTKEYMQTVQVNDDLLST
jgi:hypothetical protein